MNKAPKIFLGTKQDFHKAFSKLCDKYGYYQWFYAIAEHEDGETDICNGAHSAITESLISYVEEEMEILREKYDGNE